MPRRYLRRISREYRRNHSAWYLRPFAALLRHPRYFALNRGSVVGALTIGSAISMLPLPGHTPLAVLVALLAGMNLGVAVLGAWFNGPLTMLPVFYAEYRLGAWLLRQPTTPWPEAVSFAWLQDQLGLIWQPLYLGGVIAAVATALLVYGTVGALWSWSATRRLRRRRAAQKPSGT
jgi:uncharacterized protein (DUF2062 family)